MTLTVEFCVTSGKVRYVTRTGAHVASRRMSKRRPKNGIKVAPCQVYKCGFCQAFHVGHRDFTKGKR